MRQFHSLRWIGPAVIAACYVLAVGCSGSTSNAGKGSVPEAKSVKDKFDKVKTGMSEQEVADIMGAPASSAEMDPAKAKEMFPGGFKTPDLPGLPALNLPKMTVKVWEEGDNAYSAMFQDGKVASTASGKKEAAKQEPKITKANADKIEPGMEKSKVEAILGKGKTEASAKVPDFTGADITVWDGEEGTITIGFAGDKVASAVVWVAKKK